CAQVVMDQRLETALGKSVKLTLTCGAFQGVLHHINPGCNLLLHTVKNLETGRSSPGVKVFFSQEIVNGEALMSAEAWGSHVFDSFVQAEKTSFLNFILEKEEEERIQYTVVDCFQKKFGPAVLHLKQQDVISVVGEGVNFCPHGNLLWLQVRNVCSLFLLFLKQYSVQLLLLIVVVTYGYLPSQVADVLQFSMATGGFFPHRACTLQECLMQHLRIPSKCKTLMKCKQQMENPDIWFLRPLPASLLQVLALKAMYLLPLRSSLMDSFMADFTAVVHAYLNTSQHGSEDQLGSIKPNCLELPKELRQLADIQKLRREKAVKEHRINEDGLLIRRVLLGLLLLMGSASFSPAVLTLHRALTVASISRCVHLPCPNSSHTTPGSSARGSRSARSPAPRPRVGPRQPPPWAPPPFRRLKGERTSLPVFVRLPPQTPRELPPPRARLAGSPGRFARVPSAISVVARLYQSARRAHR
uniref:Exonuclease 3'-5' domain containing 1 n=1 Tax=Coturnix japonica TaxID=93934 RepID=A0A8C2TVI9_COTJA